jgi:hypothetical protein
LPHTGVSSQWFYLFIVSQNDLFCFFC